MMPKSCLHCPHSFLDEKQGMSTMVRCGYREQAYGWYGRVTACFEPCSAVMVEDQPPPVWCRFKLERAEKPVS